MSYKIVVDSCGELPERCKNDPHFESVPLVLDIDGHSVIDDGKSQLSEVVLSFSGALSGGLYLRGGERIRGDSVRRAERLL